jgi:hypothetical protein
LLGGVETQTPGRRPRNHVDIRIIPGRLMSALSALNHVALVCRFGESDHIHDQYVDLGSAKKDPVLDTITMHSRN